MDSVYHNTLFVISNKTVLMELMKPIALKLAERISLPVEMGNVLTHDSLVMAMLIAETVLMRRIVL